MLRLLMFGNFFYIIKLLKLSPSSSVSAFYFTDLIETSQDKVHKFPSHIHKPESICI